MCQPRQIAAFSMRPRIQILPHTFSRVALAVVDYKGCSALQGTVVKTYLTSWSSQSAAEFTEGFMLHCALEGMNETERQPSHVIERKPGHTALQHTIPSSQMAVPKKAVKL